VVHLDRRNNVPSRVRSNPIATLLAAVSAALMLIGRVNYDLWWGNWVFAVGIALLVVAGTLVFLARR
jgi:hypothetical protein